MNFALSPHDRQSGLWRRLKQHLLEERETQRARNDSPSLDATQTQVTRGRIAQLNDLLALDDPAPEVES